MSNTEDERKNTSHYEGRRHSTVKSGKELEPEVGHKGPPIARKLFGADPSSPTVPVRVLTAIMWMLVAGTYGYLSAVSELTGGLESDYGWAFLLLGVGIGAGIAGLLALSKGANKNE